ncbi:MAG TPA: DUF5660 family protein [Candidatus Saccharimonadales bacterium]|nr:DUF5660 family protein [Candidatus Saccharimonadales bacterium]
MASKVSKKRIIRNSLEAITNIGDASGVIKGVGKSLVDDMAIDGAKDFFGDFLGMDLNSSKNKASDKSEHEPQNTDANGEIDIVNFKTKSFEKKAHHVEQRVEAAIDYHRDILRSSEHASKQELHTRQSQIQQLRLEIQALASSIKVLKMEFAQVTTEQSVANVGIYQENFLEWMIKQIRAAREKVDNSSACLNISKNKQSKKGYWGMFKKHGTSFAMSNERGVATQVG